MTSIRSHNMRKSYMNEGTYVCALFECNLNIKAGEFVVISGGKNSGKSTLLHLLGGYERPSGGEIYLNDTNLNQYNEDNLAILRRDQVGYFHQTDSLIPELNIRDNITLPMLLAGKKIDEDYFEELIKHLDISDLMQLHPKQLTYGQLKCVNFARALIHKPNIILMDEPLNELYPQVNQGVLDYLLYSVYQSNRIFIMVTNNQELKACANHLIRLRDGVIVEDRLV